MFYPTQKSLKNMINLTETDLRYEPLMSGSYLKSVSVKLIMFFKLFWVG